MVFLIIDIFNDILNKVQDPYKYILPISYNFIQLSIDWA